MEQESGGSRPGATRGKELAHNRYGCEMVRRCLTSGVSDTGLSLDTSAEAAGA